MSKSNAFWHILLAVQHENRKAWKMMNWLRFIYLCYWNMNLISLPILSYVVHSSDSLLKKKQFNVAKIELWIKKVLDNLLQKDSFTTVNSFVVFFNKMFYSIFVTSLQTWKEILISIVTTTINLSKTQWRTNGIYPENHLSKIKKILSKNTSNIAHDLNNFSQRKNKINGISHLKFYCVSHVM